MRGTLDQTLLEKNSMSLVLLTAQGNMGMCEGSVWVWQVQSIRLMLGDCKAVCCFCVYQHVFVSIDRTDPEQQPQLSSHDTREVAALSLAHTL